MMRKQITFAGPAGCGKTPVANYLSLHFGLPVINNDSIRTEVKEDLLENFTDEKWQLEVVSRRDARLLILAEHDYDFIYDASVDRNWGNEIHKKFFADMATL